MKYVACPECEANFAESSMKGGRFPPHKFLSKPCPGALNIKQGDSTEREVRRVYGGSTYWIRKAGIHGWQLTGDGTPMGPPRSYAEAMRALNDVAPLTNPPRKRSKRSGISAGGFGRPRGPSSAFFVETWEERDRLHVALYFDPEHSGRKERDRSPGDGREVASWWDDDARQMFEDGFFNARDLTGSVVEYAVQMNMIEVT